MEPPLGSLEGGRLTLPLAMDQEEREGERERSEGKDSRRCAAVVGMEESDSTCQLLILGTTPMTETEREAGHRGG